jgi:hypothetical protein
MEPDWQRKVPGEPVCSFASVTPSILERADRTLRKVRVSVPNDAGGNPVAVQITGVTQDELTGQVPDAMRVPRQDRVRLRASTRSPSGQPAARVSSARARRSSRCGATSTPPATPHRRATTPSPRGPPPSTSISPCS